MDRTTRAREKAVVLLSGGIDSAVCLGVVKQYGFSCFGLIFEYGQRHRKEVYYAVKTSQKQKITYQVMKIHLPWKGSALTDTRITIPTQSAKGIPSTYVPARNLIFLSYAVSLAETIRARKIFIGAHVQDYSGYPDCRPDFLLSFQNTANLGIKHKNIEIVAPLLHNRKSEIIKLGLSLGVNFKDTWSCYRGGKAPCKNCDSCRYRMKGFKDAGIQDPLLDLRTSGKPR